MRGKGERCSLGIRREPEHAAEQRAYDHRGGPDLVRRTCRERLIVVAGENFRDVAERAVQREERVGAKVFIRWLWAMIAIFADAGPAGEQRPDGAVMISAAAEFRRAAGDDAHAPVGLLVHIGELRD